MQLDLYMFETCPYCQKVMREIQAEGRTDIVFHDIHKEEEDRQTLIHVGGKEQGKPMYESDDIVAWLKSHQKAL